MKTIEDVRNFAFSPAAKSTELILGVSLWVATVCNYPLWEKIYRLDSRLDFGFVFAFMLAITGISISTLSLLAWGKLLRPALSSFVLMAATGGYFMHAYGIVIDSSMITNVLQTDTREAADLMNLEMIATLLALTVPAMWFIWRKEKPRLSPGKTLIQNSILFISGLFLSIISLMLAFQTFASTMRNHKEVRYLINPFNSIYAVGKIAAEPLKKNNSLQVKIGEDAELGKNFGKYAAPVLILILGETARSDHFGLNGYVRESTPLLSKRDDLISFTNAWSCGTSTAESLPCMFSHLKREDFLDRRDNYENLLDIIQRAGLKSIWVDNQSGCKGICDRITSVKQETYKDNKNCGEEECFDVVMLEELQGRIDALSKDSPGKGVVVILHQMGSHGPAYFKRSFGERKRYFPECNTSALQSCTRDEVTNAYDNSIIETDYFISKTIDWINEIYPERPTAMMYVSDHGESLGEKNIYLHGLPYAFAPDAQKKIPWIVWLSESFKDMNLIESNCLGQMNNNIFISHDNYFHTALGLANVKSKLYSSNLDIFEKCRLSRD